MRSNLLTYAVSVGSRISKEYISKGGYFPSEPWGCEGQIYPSLTGVALLNLYDITKDSTHLDGAKSIIESNIKKQKSSGGWALELGVVANGVKFHVSEDVMKLTSEIEDLPPTVTALRLMSDYQQVTGDSSYLDSLDKGFNYLKKFWNESTGTFDEMLTGEALKLRASPKDYHIYAFQCVESLQRIFPEAKRYVNPLYLSVKENFEAMNGDTYPLLYGMHAAIISEVEGATDYVVTEVRKRIVEEIALKSRFLIADVPGALGHRDGLRGICLDEGHLRNSIGASLAMDFYDKAVNSTEFADSPLHEDLELWIQSMYDDGKYFEYIDLETGNKSGDGSAGYFLPLFWILGRF